MRKQVSVIIPTFMEEKYLKKTLLSIKNQSFKNYEIIVVDSNSTDKTKEIAKKHAKVYNIKKRGIAVGRNHGVKKSSAEILLFLDADTIIEKDFLKKAVKHFRNKSIISVLPHVTSINKRGRGFFWWGNTCVKIAHKLGYPMFPTTAVFYRKSIFSKVSFNENYQSGEDSDLSLRARKMGKMIIDFSLKAKSSERRMKNPVYFFTFWAVNTIKLMLGRPEENYPVIR